VEYQALSMTAIRQILALVAAADGQPRGPADEELWLGVATHQRWRASEARTAVTEMACRWTGEYGGQITPGRVAAEIKRVRSHEPAFAAQAAARPVVDEPPEERRREIIESWVAAQAAMKAVPSPHPEASEAAADSFVAGRRAGWTPPDWAAISACVHCDEQGMSRSAPDRVCHHPRTGDVPNQGCDAGVGSGAHPTTDEESDHA
jgi:hypothetical protein